MFGKRSSRIRLAGGLAVVTLALVTQALGATAGSRPCYDAYHDGLWACSQDDPQQAPTADGGGTAVFRAM